MNPSCFYRQSLDSGIGYIYSAYGTAILPCTAITFDTYANKRFTIKGNSILDNAIAINGTYPSPKSIGIKLNK